MTTTERKTQTLQLPKPEVADGGSVRLGSGMISASFPVLRRPKPEIADRGAVRLGSGMISASFPDHH
jgi:hypothetical protein